MDPSSPPPGAADKTYVAVAVPIRRELPLRVPRVSVVLVAYDSGGALLRCLASIDDSAEWVSEIVVVNNGLPGEEIEIAARSPRVKVITPPRNVGFGAGCNLGAANASGDVLVFLNPDTVAAPGAIPHLVRTLEDDSVAIAMARLRLFYEPELLNSRGNVVHITGLPWCGGHGEPAEDVTDLLDVPAPSGAAMAMRADEFRALGGFREELFLYQEDIELGWRVQMQGRRVVMNPAADVYHEYEFDRNLGKRYFMERNRLAFLLLAFSWRTLFLLSPVLVAVELGMCVLALKQRWLGQKLRGYGWLLESLPMLLRHRRKTQAARVLRDRELARLLTATIHPGVITVPALVRLVNPVLQLYWRIALRLV
jgi:GT2 family glycosyltransferase